MRIQPILTPETENIKMDEAEEKKIQKFYCTLLHDLLGGTAFGQMLSASNASNAIYTPGPCLTSKKYKKKLLKCYELLDKITSSLATYETLISLSIDDGSVIDAKEFHKLQTLYLQLMAHVRNIDRKMKVEAEHNFQKTIMDEITNLKKAVEQK